MQQARVAAPRQGRSHPGGRSRASMAVQQEHRTPESVPGGVSDCRARAFPAARDAPPVSATSFFHPRATPADQHLFASIRRGATHESVRRIALCASDLGRSDEEMQVKRLAEVEKHTEIVVRETVRFVEEEEAQRAMRLLPTQKRRVALPFGEDHHHQGSADADRLTRRESRRIGDLPICASLASDLYLQVHILPVIEQTLSAGAPASIASENLVEGVLDGE